MSYAVIYHSKTGNTKMVAEAIYEGLSTSEKRLYEMNQLQTVPEADVYLVGFSIRNRTCGIETMNFLDQIKYGKIALFATCGFYPADGYREQLEHHLAVWLPEHAEYLGMFLCQGKIAGEQAEKIIQKMPEAESQLVEMFQKGTLHPNADDLDEAREFAQNIQMKCSSIL